MKKNFVLPLLTFLASASFARAAPADPGGATYKAASTTSAGQGNFSEALQMSGDHPDSAADDTGAVDWSAGYTRSRVPVGTASDNSNLFDVSVGYRRSWDVGAGFAYSRTIEENLTATGPNLWLGYIFALGSGPKEEFRPSIEPKFSFKTAGYKQTFSGTVTRVGSRRTITRPTTGSESIQQNDFTLGLEVNPVEVFTGSLNFSAYRYNKDVSRFLGLLDTPRAVSSGAAQFSDTLGGFPKNTAELDLLFRPWESWELELDLLRSKVQLDNTNASSEKLELTKQLTEHWKLGLGFEHEASDQYGQENLTLLDLAYSF